MSALDDLLRDPATRRCLRVFSGEPWTVDDLLACLRVYTDEFAARDNADRTRAMLDRQTQTALVNGERG